MKEIAFWHTHGSKGGASYSYLRFNMCRSASYTMAFPALKCPRRMTEISTLENEVNMSS